MSCEHCKHLPVPEPFPDNALLCSCGREVSGHALIKHHNATIKYEHRLIGHGPSEVPAIVARIADVLKIDAERLKTAQTHPFGFDITLDGEPLQLTQDETTAVYEGLPS